MSIVNENCAESCKVLNSCPGLTPEATLMLGRSIAKSPYAICVDKAGPTDSEGRPQRCHLSPEVKTALGGVAAGMRLAQGEEVTVEGPVDDSGRRSEVSVVIDSTIEQIQPQHGYLRPVDAAA